MRVVACVPLYGVVSVVAMPGAVGVSTITLVTIPVSPLDEVYGPVFVSVVVSVPLYGVVSVVAIAGAVGVSTITLVMIPVLPSDV